MDQLDTAAFFEQKCGKKRQFALNLLLTNGFLRLLFRLQNAFCVIKYFSKYTFARQYRERHKNDDIC